MSTDAIGSKGAGRERIQNALLGLGLLLISFLVLRTINPELVDLNVDLTQATTKVRILHGGVTAQNLEQYIAEQEALRAELTEDGWSRKNSSSSLGFRHDCESGNQATEGLLSWGTSIGVNLALEEKARAASNFNAAADTCREQAAELQRLRPDREYRCALEDQWTLGGATAVFEGSQRTYWTCIWEREVSTS